MQKGKWNCILDSFWGSSGKGKASAWLADRYGVTLVSSSNFPNAGHTAAFEDGTKFVAKAIPTAAILKKTSGLGMKCFISPGSGFFWPQLIKEWIQCDKPDIFIHSRASIVTPDHAERERNGAESTKHIASTMQGSAAAIVDKVLRKADCALAGSIPLDRTVSRLFESEDMLQEFLAKVHIVEAFEFRNLVHSNLQQNHTFLHEGSQGYSLSIDHGSHFPHCTSRNCSLQAAMDHMAIPPALVGDVYLNLRTFPIRVGNVVEDGVQKGFSGGFYPDCTELTWEQIASDAGMPKEEADKLAERERTTVTKRIRRVCNFSFIGLRDAVRTNGATKLIMNFIQYIDWKDAGLKGGPEEIQKLSKKSREFLAKVEEAAGIPIVLIGTGPLHDDVIVTGAL